MSEQQALWTTKSPLQTLISQISMLSYNIIRFILLEVIDGGSIISIQILMSFFFYGTRKKIKFSSQRTSNCQDNAQSWGHHTPNFKTYFKATLVRTLWCWLKNRSNETGWKSQKKPTNLFSVNFLTKVPRISWEKGPWFCESWVSTHRRMELNSYSVLHAKTNPID